MQCFTRNKKIKSKKKKVNNFDEKQFDQCAKVFPQVSEKGMTYLFLLLCPRQVHCYGFHIIPGSEGREDLAAADYTHISITMHLALANMLKIGNQGKTLESLATSFTGLHIIVLHP